MNRRVVFLTTFAAVMLMTFVTYAQERQRQRQPGRMGMMGFGANTGRLLRAESVQKELNITDEQMTKINEALEAGRPGAGQRPNFQDMTDEERTKFREEMEKRSAEQDKKINEILNEQQQKRLKQIRVQLMGAFAFSDEQVGKDLAITDEQRDKIREAFGEIRDAMQDVPQGERAARGREMTEKMNAKVMEILTDEQKAKYKEMVGEPFDVSQLRMGGPGGGPGGGRRGGN